MGVTEQGREHLNRRDQRRFQHAINDVEKEMNKPGGGTDYYARLVVEEANRQLDRQEQLRGANRGEVYNYRYFQDEQGIHTQEIQVKDRRKNVGVFDTPSSGRPGLPPPKK